MPYASILGADFYTGACLSFASTHLCLLSVNLPEQTSRVRRMSCIEQVLR